MSNTAPESRVPRGARGNAGTRFRRAGRTAGQGRAALRVFFVGGRISYRALFNWISPVMYVTTMLGSPLFQILFFTYLGRYAGSRSDDFFIVGNAVQVSAMAGIYGMVMGIANERQFGTLTPLLATPANRLAVFAGRALPNIVNGLVVSSFGFAASWLLLDFSPDAASLPALAFVVVVTVVSCTALGMLIGSIGLRARDVFFAANLVYFLMLLFCGVNVDVDSLPGWMEAIGRSVPLTHGIEAARRVVEGATLGDVRGLIVTEALIGIAYAVAAYVLFRFFEAESRRRASLETF
ncbi:MAG: ABC transporter permease [Gaiellaceae bacterium MAG52_C11]|nr:ABC transporter permease [Candidatus Gaiellasilicea maunaloa]